MNITIPELTNLEKTTVRNNKNTNNWRRMLKNRGHEPEDNVTYGDPGRRSYMKIHEGQITNIRIGNNT